MNNLGMKPIIYLLSTILFLIGCSRQPASTKPLVITSIPPYTQMVEAIAGDLVSVKSFIQPTDNPHTFSPTPRLLDQVQKASLWIGIGEPYEDRLHAFHARELDLSKHVKLLNNDRHIWMSLRLAIFQVKLIAQTLGELFPENAYEFKINANKYIEKLRALDTLVTGMLKPYTGQAVLVSHPAFYYFCYDYKLLEIPLEHQGKDPLPRQTANILQMSESNTFRCAFSVPQGSDKGIRLISTKLGIPLYDFNPLAPDYLQNMQHLAQLIAQ